MLSASTGYKKKILGPHSWASIFQQGAIYIFGGTRPASADMAPGVPAIAVISNHGLPWTPTNLGAGLVFTLRDQFVLGDPTQDWKLRPNAFAEETTASWWRLVAPFDTGLASVTEARIDGDIGLKSAPNNQELLLDTTTLSPGEAISVSTFFYAIPPL